MKYAEEALALLVALNKARLDPGRAHPRTQRLEQDLVELDARLGYVRWGEESRVLQHGDVYRYTSGMRETRQQREQRLDKMHTYRVNRRRAQS